MSFLTWLSQRRSDDPAARRRTPTSPSKRASFRPRLDALEDRWLPSGTADALNNLPLFFETNQGQADPQVRYLSRGPGYALLLSDTGILTIGPSLYTNLPYTPKDIVPVINLAKNWLVLVAPERAAPWISFQQAMDCLGLEAGALGEALCGATGRGTERDRDALGDQNFQQ